MTTWYMMTSWVMYTVSQKKRPPFIFPITLSKINRFWWFLVCEILRKFDIDSLYICPPYLYTVTTFPWEIQKSNLFTYCRLLLSVICVALFYGQFLSLWSVIFKATNANPQPALFRVTNIWRNTTLSAVECKSFAFYKVVWWHFSGVVVRG